MRNKFIETGEIPVADIRLDTKNYRIGEAEDQADCIELIFRAFGTKMERIAEHIAEEGLSPKQIVVQRQNGNWVVKDGNRRICAIQLLNNPALAPEAHRQAFIKIKNDHSASGNIPISVNCITSDDPQAILNYMKLEHMGPQEGVGQVDWGSREKDNLALDSGGKISSPIARVILSYLQKHGIEEAKTVKITNIQRILQDSYAQTQLGLVINGDELFFTLNEEETRKALTEIVLDFATRKVRVGAIYDKSDRESYIDTLLGARGFRPSPIPTVSTPSTPSTIKTPSPLALTPPTTPTPAPPGPIPVAIKPPRDRARLIPRGQGMRVPTTEAKVLSIINELSAKIDVREAPISASVLLRLLVEFSVGNYISTNSIIAIDDNAKLHVKIGKVGDHLVSCGKIDSKQHALLKKMCKADEILSTHTLNQYVHSTTYMPTPKELCVFWDRLYFFLRACW
jgi:hypothetical protein